jgi:hypothetical protein
LDAERAEVRKFLFILLILVGLVPSAWAHVGSKDVFETVDAGTYRLFVTIRPPTVIPGVAEVEVRVTGGATGVEITPVPLTGEASLHPPAADRMKVSASDPAYFTGAVWMMAPGSWQVRFAVDGPAGRQVASVPVAAMALSTLKMQRGMGVGLGVLGLFLVLSMAGLVAAAVREARLPAGVVAGPTRKRRGWVALVVSLAVLVFIVYWAGRWWDFEAAAYAESIFRPMKTTAVLSGDVLDLTVKTAKTRDEDRRPARRNDDFLPDHGHLMHLYAIRWPEMDAAFHLHPELAGAGDFRMTLPTMPAGTYRLYGDVVHASGFPETLTAEVTVPADKPGAALGPEDAEALPPGISKGELGAKYLLPDGYTMIWDEPAKLFAGKAYLFHFRLVGPDGKPAAGMQAYLGMAGHAAFVKSDGSVFAHTHPEGSAAMAAMDLANGMTMATDPVVGPEVEFPYGFPSAGRYRVFIQMKHGGVVETGVFDAVVE